MRKVNAEQSFISKKIAMTENGSTLPKVLDLRLKKEERWDRRWEAKVIKVFENATLTNYCTYLFSRRGIK